jgi:hypothetical protein
MKRFLIAVLVLVSISACATKWNIRYGVPEEALYKTESIPRLMSATKDEDPRVRVAAIRFLYKFSDPSIMDTLRKISESDSDPKVRNYAQKAIVASMIYAGINRVNPPARLSAGISSVEVTIQPSSVFFTGKRNLSIVQARGILPVKISLKNLSDTPVRIDTSAFNLIMPDGKIARLSSPHEVNLAASPCYDNRGSCTTISNAYSQGVWARITTDQRTNEQIREPRSYPEFAPENGLIEGYVFFTVPQTLTSLENWKFEMGIKKNEEFYIIEDTFFAPLAVKGSANAPGATKPATTGMEKRPVAAPQLEPVEEEN